MYIIKEKYRSQSVQFKGTNGRMVLFDCTKNYSQKQLSVMAKSQGFKEYIEKVDGKKELNLKDVKKDEVKGSTEVFPELSLAELEEKTLADLRVIYPFISARSRDSFISELLNLNYGNPKESNEEEEE